MTPLVVNRRSVGYPVSPLASLLTLGREFDRVFETPLAALGRDYASNTFAPPLELHEDKDTVRVRVELPGIERKDVSVTFHDGVLTISGERRNEVEVKEGETFRTERSYGRFERQVTFAQPVDADAVKASFQDGLLTVTLPKSAAAKPKSISIGGN